HPAERPTIIVGQRHESWWKMVSTEVGAVFSPKDWHNLAQGEERSDDALGRMPNPIQSERLRQTCDRLGIVTVFPTARPGHRQPRASPKRLALGYVVPVLRTETRKQRSSVNDC